MRNCISQEYKDLMINMITQDLPKIVIEGFIKTVPSCEITMQETIAELKREMAPARVTPAKREEAKRAISPRWPGVRYFNEQGKEEPWDSPSGLYTHLTGKSVSGQVCTEDGTSCRALSIVDNFQLHGYTVMGNGEPPPPQPRRCAPRSGRKGLPNLERASN